MKVCSRPGCPNIHAGTGRCPTCQRETDQARGTTAQRGYNAQHKALRKAWDRKVQAGGVRCARCGELIAPGTPWHLDHTDDRTGYLGPSHGSCNTAAPRLAGF